MLFEHFRPQTLSAFKNEVTVKSRSFGVSAFEARPTSASLLARTLEAWSLVESSSLLQYACLLGGPYSEDTIAYMRQKPDSHRDETLKHYLFESLSGPELQIIGCLNELKYEYKVERDKLVDWSWSFSEGLKNAVLLSDPRMQFGHPYSEFMEPERSNIFVYSDKEFKCLIKGFEKLASCFSDFGHFRSKRDKACSKEAFERISSDPVMVNKMKIWNRIYGL